MAHFSLIPLPKQWPDHIKSAVLHAMALASAAFANASAWASKRRSRIARLQAALERAKSEISLLKEELNIKNARWMRISPHRRPHYSPFLRMRILKLKAARGWTKAQTAKAFILSEHTISCWLRRIDEQGEHALIQLPEPVNKFPDFVRYIVGQLKLFFPALGKRKIAQILARAGLHLGATTVRRMWTPKPADEKEGQADEEKKAKIHVVKAKYPNHICHVDLTVIPTRAGFWIPWVPFAWPQRWPFCWWVAVVLDHCSRLFVGYGVFQKRPSSKEICFLLEQIFKRTGHKPKHMISDKESIFDCSFYKSWCRKREILFRFGAVGKHGSIAVVERFIRSMKSECTRRIFIPYRREKIREELSLYALWYNEHRPHEFLGGVTPREAYDGTFPANQKPRFEPRPKWPRGSRCAAPQAVVKGKPGRKLVLVLGFVEGRRHLPVISLKNAA